MTRLVLLYETGSLTRRDRVVARTDEIKEYR